MDKSTFFPHVISGKPAADIPLDGIESYLIQAEDQQFIFMEFTRDVIIPEHAHEAQWGVVLDGEIELTIAGEKRLLRKGDTYFIERNVPHSAKISKGYKDLTLFNQADRYKQSTV